MIYLIPALRIIHDAVRVVLRLPDGAAWAITVTNEDGSGADPLFGSLTIVASSPADVMTKLGGEWERFSREGEREMFVTTVGHLEISVEEGTS